jgi:hypothetical protein
MIIDTAILKTNDGSRYYFPSGYWSRGYLIENDDIEETVRECNKSYIGAFLLGYLSLGVFSELFREYNGAKLIPDFIDAAFIPLFFILKYYIHDRPCRMNLTEQCDDLSLEDSCRIYLRNIKSRTIIRSILGCAILLSGAFYVFMIRSKIPSSRQIIFLEIVVLYFISSVYIFVQYIRMTRRDFTRVNG